MTAVELYKPPAADVAVYRPLDDWIPVLAQVVDLAQQIAGSPFVPEGLRGSVPAVAAAILTGRELGIPPMTALANIHLIKGKTGLSALLMRALIQAQGHEWQDVHVTDTRVVVRGRRRGETEWTEAAFDADQAKRASITLQPYPQDKLYARATVRLARRKFADVIAGMPYSAEELEDGDDGHVTEAADTPETPAAEAPKPRTAQRKARATETYVDDGSKGISLPPEQQTYFGPPLPDEDEPPRDLATTGQVGIIASHFKRLGFNEDERDQRLAVTATIAGRDPIGSTKELTQDQAKRVADTLSRCKDRERLIALLAEGEVAGNA